MFHELLLQYLHLLLLLFLVVPVLFHQISLDLIRQLHILLLLGLYFVHYWRRGGQTLAMQTWGIRVVDATQDRPPELKRALARYLLSWPSLWFGGAGLIWALFDRERQFLHDRLAGTRVIRIK